MPEFRRRGQMADVHERQLVTIAGDAPPPVTLAAGPRTVVVEGVEVRLAGEGVVGGRTDLHLTFTDASTGKPVDDLQPFLAAAGHIVVMRADAQTFAHEHAEVTHAEGRPVFATPGERRPDPRHVADPPTRRPTRRIAHRPSRGGR
jgi:P-type Cu+ transporter